MEQTIGKITELNRSPELRQEIYDKLISSGKLPTRQFTWENCGGYIYGESPKLYARIEEIDNRVFLTLYQNYTTVFVAKVYLDSEATCKIFAEYFLRNFT